MFVPKLKVSELFSVQLKFCIFQCESSTITPPAICCPMTCWLTLSRHLSSRMGCDICHIDLQNSLQLISRCLSPATALISTQNQSVHPLLLLCRQTIEVSVAWPCILFGIVPDFLLYYYIIAKSGNWAVAYSELLKERNTLKDKRKTKPLSKRGEVLYDVVKIQELMNCKRCNFDTNRLRRDIKLCDHRKWTATYLVTAGWLDRVSHDVTGQQLAHGVLEWCLGPWTDWWKCCLGR